MEEALGRAALPEGLCEVFIGFLRKAALRDAPLGPQALSDCLTWHSPSAQGGRGPGNVTPFDRWECLSRGRKQPEAWASVEGLLLFNLVSPPSERGLRPAPGAEYRWSAAAPRVLPPGGPRLHSHPEWRVF